jgi:cation/acetate symporter
VSAPAPRRSRRHAEAFGVGGKTPEEIEKNRGIAKKNFLALIACLMIGTAALPHILMRYYTTPSVHEARVSVFWGLFFIFLLYFTAPALAILAKYEVYSNLVGSSFSALPAWVSNWSTVDKTLMNIADINKDGIVQLAEIVIGGDLIVLATPEIAGLPYVISGLVAAGGLAAALSTADGLLLTIANAMSHDLYYKMIDPNASTVRRIAVSKGLLLVVALTAAYVTSLKPGDILFLVGAAFSLAASGFFPALVCGVFWKRANYLGAVLGMSSGSGRLRLLHVHDLSLLRRQCAEVVGHQPDLGRHLRHSRRLPRHHHRQPDFPGAEQGNPGTGRPCALSEPGRRHRHQGRLISLMEEEEG